MFLAACYTVCSSWLHFCSYESMLVFLADLFILVDLAMLIPSSAHLNSIVKVMSILSNEDLSLFFVCTKSFWRFRT